jgi:hypothetical protein
MYQAISDNNLFGSLHLFAFSPNPEKPVKVTKPQLGKYGPGGVVVPDETNSEPSWTNNATDAAKVIAINYLLLAGKTDLIPKIFGTLPAPATELYAFADKIVEDGNA